MIPLTIFIIFFILIFLSSLNSTYVNSWVIFLLLGRKRIVVFKHNDRSYSNEVIMENGVRTASVWGIKGFFVNVILLDNGAVDLNIHGYTSYKYL